MTLEALLAAAERRSEPAWLGTVRTAALADFRKTGLPTRRDESWKYTPIEREPGLAFDAAPSVQRTVRADNGVQVADLTSPEAADLVARHLGQVLPAREHPLAALNGALFDHGLLIRVPAGRHIETPLQLTCDGVAAGTPVQFHTRLLVVVEAGASATLVERHGGQGVHFANHVTEIVLEAGARLSHIKLQDDPAGAVQIDGQCHHSRCNRGGGIRDVTCGEDIRRTEMLWVIRRSWPGGIGKAWPITSRAIDGRGPGASSTARIRSSISSNFWIAGRSHFCRW